MEGQEQEQVLYKHTFFALGGPNELQVAAVSESEAQEHFQCLEQEVKRIEAKYSRYQSDSIVSKINAAAGKDFVSVDEETAALLEYASQCYAQSFGLFDITSGILRKAWDFKAKKIPTAQELEPLLSKIGWKSVEWTTPRIRLPIEGMEIDFGGFGKEYAVDRLGGICLERNILHALINLGGDVRVVGGQSADRPWKIGISHPRKEKEVIAYISLINQALATSGDYERFFEVDGKRYCHVLSPKSGYPVNDFQSVTIVSDSCLIAGTLSTTVMLLGKEKGLRMVKDSRLPYFVVLQDGSLHTHEVQLSS